jgi:hypothetical protein
MKSELDPNFVVMRNAVPEMGPLATALISGHGCFVAFDRRNAL